MIPPLKLLDRVNTCEHCVLNADGSHQYYCKTETDRRSQVIWEMKSQLGRPCTPLIELDREAMQEAA
jgi:hypothetical protein